MPIELTELVESVRPENTILLFGSGASIPSGAPSVSDLIAQIGKTFRIEPDGFSLSEISSLAEQKTSRHDLITAIRTLFSAVKPTGSLLNLPLYDWKNIYTTNYDDLIERSYLAKNRCLSVYSSNFDFTIRQVPEATKLFKLHGTIGSDVSDGHQARIIITEQDYDLTNEYREALFDTLKADLHSGDLLIIGNSLSDQHIKDIINRAISIKSIALAPSRIFLLLYTPDINRAALYERRGIRVCFSDLDSFFSELFKKAKQTSHVFKATGDPLDTAPALRPVTLDVSHAVQHAHRNVSSMFNGWPATYADIAGGLTFDRTFSRAITHDIQSDDIACAYLLGASGTGKSTVARQVLLALLHKGYWCWEHKDDHSLLPKYWRSVAASLKEKGEKAVLFIDDAYNHLYEINDLLDLLVADNNNALKIVLASARNQWYPRVKTPNMFKHGRGYVLSKLDNSEVESLLVLVETNPELQPLIENSFSGFSRAERKRRLTVRCESDTFVCLKNIFASDKFDDIVLREFAELDDSLQTIYRLVAAMESSGVKVHRQLVVRVLGIPAETISALLASLVDIIHEYTISEREGTYGWRGRHPVITDIVTKYKMSDVEAFIALFETVIDNIIPTYEVEIRTIRQLCNVDTGISRIPNKAVRNKLLRKMISKAPGERVPRHRLIRNLIEMGELEKADTEIRLFENDFRVDGPVYRYKVMLLLARADTAPGLMEEDRRAILETARETAAHGIEKFKNNKDILRVYCDVGVAYFKRTGDMSAFDDALEELKLAEERIGDPDITRLIVTYERLISGREHDTDDVEPQEAEVGK